MASNVNNLGLNYYINIKLGQNNVKSYFLPAGNSKVLDCLSQPDIKGVANKSVTDRYLLDPRKILEAVKILEV